MIITIKIEEVAPDIVTTTMDGKGDCSNLEATYAKAVAEAVMRALDEQRKGLGQKLLKREGIIIDKAIEGDNG